MEKTRITMSVTVLYSFRHLLIRKRGSRGTMRMATTISRKKARSFSLKLIEELSGNDSVNKVDMLISLNLQLSGWANFYKYTDNITFFFNRNDRIVFWKFAYGLACKYRTSIKKLLIMGIDRPAKSSAKTWMFSGRDCKGNFHKISLRLLVGSLKIQFK